MPVCWMFFGVSVSWFFLLVFVGSYLGVCLNVGWVLLGVCLMFNLLGVCIVFARCGVHAHSRRFYLAYLLVNRQAMLAQRWEERKEETLRKEVN